MFHLLFVLLIWTLFSYTNNILFSGEFKIKCEKVSKFAAIIICRRHVYRAPRAKHLYLVPAKWWQKLRARLIVAQRSQHRWRVCGETQRHEAGHRIVWQVLKNSTMSMWRRKLAESWCILPGIFLCYQIWENGLWMLGWPYEGYEVREFFFNFWIFT